MKQEEKELLLKDLCARLPYETRVRYTYAFAGTACITGYSDEGILSYDKLQDFSLPNVGYETRRVVNILPYLRPISSMTEEEFYKVCFMNNLSHEELEDRINYSIFLSNYTIETFDLFNSNHLDYRGLIAKGLALEAPEGMYKKGGEE